MKRLIVLAIAITVAFALCLVACVTPPDAPAVAPLATPEPEQLVSTLEIEIVFPNQFRPFIEWFFGSKGTDNRIIGATQRLNGSTSSQTITLYDLQDLASIAPYSNHVDIVLNPSSNDIDVLLTALAFQQLLDIPEVVIPRNIHQYSTTEITTYYEVLLGSQLGSNQIEEVMRAIEVTARLRPEHLLLRQPIGNRAHTVSGTLNLFEILVESKELMLFAQYRIFHS